MKGLSLVTKSKKQTIISLLCTILIVSFTNPLIIKADEIVETTNPIGASQNGMWDNFFVFIKVMFVLLFIIGLIILLIRFLAQKNKILMANRAIKNLSGVQLGQNKSVQIIEIGRSLYVIGVGENVELIEKIDQSEEINFIKESLHTTNRGIGTERFAVLNQWADGFTKKVKNKLTNVIHKNDEEEKEVSFQEVFNQKMKQVSVRKKRVEELLSDDNHKERSSD